MPHIVPTSTNPRSKSSQLSRLAERFGIAGSIYWTQDPRSPRESSGPGWYLSRNGDPSDYLGHTYVAACEALADLRPTPRRRKAAA